MYLLHKVIDSFSSQDGKVVGLPLGNLTSQLLVNIYMNEFDHFIKDILKVKYYIRYADDFVILSENKIYLEKLLLEVKLFLANNLKLSLHPDKVYIKTLSSGIDFLGWINFPYHRVLRTSTKHRMVRRIKEFPTEDVRASYLGLLKHGATYFLSKKIKKYFSSYPRP